jgi:hypothetical protein
MLSKKFIQSNLQRFNNKIIKRIFTYNFINSSYKTFAVRLNINFSHIPNALTIDTLRSDKKINNIENNSLSDTLLKKLGKNLFKKLVYFSNRL